MAEQNLEKETTETLLEYIRWKEDVGYVEIAKEAFRVFTYRYQIDLQKKLIPICKNWGYDRQVATEIAYSTFERVWKYPTYSKEKSKQTDFEKGLMFYLYGIARRLLADYKKFENGDGNPFTGDEEIVWDFPEDANKERKAILADRQEHIKNLLGRLSPKHRVIYLTYKQYESETKGGRKLPRELLKKLRTELDLAQSTVRSYKNEAFNEVEIYLKTYGSK